MRKLISFVLWCLTFCLTTPVMGQLNELSGKTIKAIDGEASSLVTHQWYLMYNRGRKTYAYENTEHNMIYVKATNVPTAGDNAEEKCAFLIRIVEGNSSGQYYLQTGYGHFFGSLIQGSSNNVTTDKSVYYTYNTIKNTKGHFYFNDANGDELIVADASKTLYSLDVYHGNNDKKIVYSNGEVPVLPQNSIAFISGNNKFDAPASLTEGENIINGYNMASLITLTDKKEFYSPTNFTAAEVNFDRQIGAYEMKFVVVPFECSTSNIMGSVFMLDSIRDNMVNFISFNGKMNANTPYLVYSENEGHIINDITNINFEATPNNMSVSCNNAQLIASYKTFTPNNNSFEYVVGWFERKLDECLPFETVLTLNDDIIHDRYFISFNDIPTDIEVLVTDESLFPADVYDLSGKLISKNAKNLDGLAKGIYIVKGRKIINF